jgi:hypothetical protein
VRSKEVVDIGLCEQLMHEYGETPMTEHVLLTDGVR